MTSATIRWIALAGRQEVKALNSIDKIGKAIDSIADDGFFTYGYFKTLETTTPSDERPIYLAIYDKDEIAAAAPFYLNLNQTHEQEISNRFSRRIASKARYFGLHPERLFSCFSPSSYHSKILVKKDYDSKMVLNQICTKIDEICREKTIMFSSFPYVSEFEDSLVHNLPDFGYQLLPSENTLTLDVKWSSFEDYLENLESHKIRTTVKREIRKCRESGVLITEEHDFGDLAVTLARLHSNLFSKYNKGIGSPRGVSFFKGLYDYAKDKTRVFVAKKNNKIIGFSLSLQQKATLDVHLCGFDYDTQANTDFTYFNVVYYATIEMAIKEKIRKIHYSIKSERVKQKRGCKLERNYSFIKCHNRMLRPLYSIYSKRRRC